MLAMPSRSRAPGIQLPLTRGWLGELREKVVVHMPQTVAILAKIW